MPMTFEEGRGSMNNTATVLAFDFGASSGRAIRAVYDGQNLTYEEIHRFENIPIEKTAIYAGMWKHC